MTTANSTPLHAVILCHPNADSFNAAVAQRYCEAVREIGQVAILRDLYRMGFDPVLQPHELVETGGAALAADVSAEIEEIRSADAFVLVYPIWFGTPPAMLKGYVERVFGAGLNHRAMGGHERHRFMADKHLLSLSSSGNSIQWLEGQGAWVSLRNVFDTYLATAFSMDPPVHVHFSNIVDSMTQSSIDEELYRVREIARETCSRFVGTSRRQHGGLASGELVAATTDSHACTPPAK